MIIVIILIVVIIIVLILIFRIIVVFLGWVGGFGGGVAVWVQSATQGFKHARGGKLPEHVFKLLLIHNLNNRNV